MAAPISIGSISTTSEGRGLLPETPEPSRHGLQGAGSDQGLSCDHQRADGDQRFVAEAVEKVGGPHGAERPGEGKQLKADDQDDQDEQAGRFERDFFPGEQEQRQHGEHQYGQGMDVRYVGKGHHRSASPGFASRSLDYMSSRGSNPEPTGGFRDRFPELVSKVVSFQNDCISLDLCQINSEIHM
jgi:hypothetical protein